MSDDNNKTKEKDTFLTCYYHHSYFHKIYYE